MSETFKGKAQCVVFHDGETYGVQLTITDIPDEERAKRIGALVEEAFNAKVREIGGKIEGWTS